MAPDQVELEVQSLKSRLVGIKRGDVTHFRGIPYASATKRWTHSKQLDRLESPFDATRYGPRCPQPERVEMWSNEPPGGEMAIESDEFRCLNLNITLPTEALDPTNSPDHRLPVIVWIHGGAFVFGANSAARHEPERLCRLAKNSGNPVIIVSINYRLGPLGYAASADLASELSQSEWQGLGSDNPDYNSILGSFGQIDQRNALQWVQDHISGFGGDAQNVTACGVSAGSVSIHYHMITGDPLFDRAIMMAGAAGTIGPVSSIEYERAWDVLVEKSNVKGTTESERLTQLRSLSAQEVVMIYPRRSAMGPSGDGKLLPQTWTHKSTQVSSRCKAIIIGDNRDESIIMNSLIRSTTPSGFRQLAQASLTSPLASELLEKFGFEQDLGLDGFHNTLRRFLSTVIFHFPALALADTYPGDTYHYHVEEPSPYPGASYGHAAHGLCSMFLFFNGIDLYPESARKVSDFIAKRWTAFAHGVEPWPRFKQARQFMRLGPQGEITLTDCKSDGTRSYEYVEWLDENYEEVLLFARSFLAKDWSIV